MIDNIDRLRHWLADAETQPVGEHLDARLIAGGRSNPTYELTDGRRSWILRRPPVGHVLPTAHDMGREYRALTALQGSAVPVPRTVALCDDTTVIGARFYVMDKLEGITLRTAQDTARLTEQQRENLSRNAIQVLADLHRIDPAQVGLADWGRPDGYLERQLSRWMRQWQSSVTRERPQIEELHSVAGEYDFLAKVRTTHARALEDVLYQIKAIEGVARTTSTVVLNTEFDDRPLDLGWLSADKAV